MQKKIIYLTLFLMIFHAASAKVGLVLSGGGARGFAHVGVLKVIDELNIKIDYIAGTSIGAVVGALYAQGYSAIEIEEILLNDYFEDVIEGKISREDLYIGEKRWLPSSNYYFDISENFTPKLPRSLFLGNRLTNKFFQYYFPSTDCNDFDDLHVPFRTVATDIVTGEKKVFDSGSLHEAVRASASVPSLIAPFELENKLYVDGGVRANFPTEVVREMGADIVIGIRVNTGLKEEDELNSLLQIYDQTLNISIADNVGQSLKLCDILIQPKLEDINVSDFKMRNEIISLGECAAREQVEQLNELAKNSRPYLKKNLENMTFGKIEVEGNSHLSSTKVREFVGLKKDIAYSCEDICDAIEHAYCSKLFDVIYPTIESKNNINILTLKILEAKRKKVGVGIVYDNEDELVLGATLELNNVLQRNSKLLVNLKIGGKQELNVDYVKNFGKLYGAYYRLFPYVRESIIYSYNENHEKENSVLSLESGGTLGVGFFAEDAIIAEFYGFGLHNRLYRHIAEFEDTDFVSSGFGLKLYHESLDDVLFPTRGGSIFAKLSVSRKELFSEFNTSKFYSKISLIIPFNSLSFKYGWEYGVSWHEESLQFDQFYIGGIDSFLGLFQNEMNAPVFHVNTLALIFQPTKNFFIDLQYNLLNLGEKSELLPSGDKYIYSGYGIKFGYKTRLMPLRGALGFDEDFNRYLYLSVGYEFDEFFFSRK